MRSRWTLAGLVLILVLAGMLVNSKWNAPAFGATVLTDEQMA